MRLRRAEPPPWLIGADAEVNQEAWRHLSGEQAEWGYVIPQTYRVLADPDSGHELMRAPQAGDDLSVACAYWSALLHLTTYSLGWIRPERGIIAWQIDGTPDDDARLQLLAEVWDGDGMLDWFHAWTYGQHSKEVTDRLGELVGFYDDDEDSPMTPGWDEDQKDLADASGIPAPCSHGGYDPLHLSAHLAGPLEEPPRRVELIRTEPRARRAVLLLDSMVGWYRALAMEGDALPDLGERSWHVEVVIRSVGSLGVYRRSRETGIWFAGPHRYHVLGIGKHTWRYPQKIIQVDGSDST